LMGFKHDASSALDWKETHTKTCWNQNPQASDCLQLAQKYFENFELKNGCGFVNGVPQPPRLNQHLSHEEQ
jgi:hypothetical protein